MRTTVAVVLVDAMLLVSHVTHVIHRTAPLQDPSGHWFSLLRSGSMWDGGADGSIMELFGLVQLSAAALLFLRRGILESTARVLAAWGAVFLLLVLDDLFRVHERVGARLDLSRAVPSLDEVAAQQLGGLIFWAVSGLVLVGGLIGLHRRSVPAARSVSRSVLVTVTPFVIAATGYVLFTAVCPGMVHSFEGHIVALARMTVKLLTMTLLLVQAMRPSAVEK